MKELVLRPRLQCVFDEVPMGSRVLDIGTDHARLPCSLVQKGRAVCAVATDIKDGPLERASAMLDTTCLWDKVSLMKRDGLQGIDPCVANVITITGMGGETIADILDAGKWPHNGTLLILQGTTNTDILRRYLSKNHYRVMREILTEDTGRVYQTLVCGDGEDLYEQESDYFTGRYFEKNELYDAFLERLEKRFEKAIRELKLSDLDQTQKINEFQEILDGIRRKQ